MRAGSLPEALAGLLGMLRIAAIVGTELFVRFPVVTFDYPAARIMLGRESPAPAAS
jgi:hypothetical protein